MVLKADQIIEFMDRILNFKKDQAPASTSKALPKKRPNHQKGKFVLNALTPEQYIKNKKEQSNYSAKRNSQRNQNNLVNERTNNKDTNSSQDNLHRYMKSVDVTQNHYSSQNTKSGGFRLKRENKESINDDVSEWSLGASHLQIIDQNMKQGDLQQLSSNSSDNI